MAYNLQYGVAQRDAQNDALEASVGPTPILRVYNGTAPANCAAALSGNTLLAQGTLPTDWLGASSSGAKSKLGTWTLTGQAGASASAGTFFRLFKADGTTCTMQGTFGVGTFDMQPDVNSISNAQTVTVSTFTLTRGNA